MYTKIKITILVGESTIKDIEAIRSGLIDPVTIGVSAYKHFFHTDEVSISNVMYEEAAESGITTLIELTDPRAANENISVVVTRWERMSEAERN